MTVHENRTIQPDLESLRCFVEAAERRSFRLAAARVALSPAAFSGRIRRLEETLGAPLFARTSRRVALAAAGERLLPQARRCLEEAARCAEVARDEGRRPPFALVVGTRYELGMSWLVPSLSTLRRARPERRIHLYFGDSPDLLGRVERGQLDAMVSSARLASGGLGYASLHEERYALVARPGLCDERPLRRPGDARGHVLVDLHDDLPLFRYFVDARPGREAWLFGDVEYLGTIGAVRLRVLEGAGVAVLPRYFVARDLARGRLVEPLPSARLQADHFRLVWHARHPLAAELAALGEELRAIPLK